ncbi:glycoside hydrolase family 127 protein [Aliifodinibius sp. S!AR15-10]|uniref:glycoside hydrolase family 127 protein n=1 Tax=Aliifodinibius sp. S!AR15-10 TaxID=2950437 RepID=UPI0028673964|nr:beta-L-arabinofuranosidase domain-containing protein [Aliifodinibius sp. S!AR15-10]MDR8392928.1 glycoside hydrolase family 127 protein [Aliifodinibius sp. S!AR15-10]
MSLDIRKINWVGYCLLLAVMLLGGCSSGNEESTDKFTIVPSRDIVKAEQFELSEVQLLESPFKDAKERDGKYLLSLNPDRLLAPYLKQARMEPEVDNYGGWESTGLDGHSLGHYLSAISMMSATSDNEEFKQRVDHIVSTLATVQDSIGTGYVAGIPNGKEIFDEIASGNIDAEPFGLNDGWVPWYNIHKLYAGLRDAYLYANSDLAREVLVKLSDWAVNLSNQLSGEQFRQMIRAEYGGMNEVLTDVYAITGDKKYLEVAQRFNDQRLFDPLASGEDQLEGLHANTQIPKIIGAAREYEFTGNNTLQQVATFFWETVVNNRTYANGGNSMNEHFGELGKLAERLSKVTSETCNTYNMLKLTEHLMKWYPDEPKYAAYYEKALYNHILASQDPKTGMVCYFVPLISGHFKTFSSPEDSFWCCVGSGMENHTKYGKNIYLHTDSELFVNLFIPSEVTWNPKEVTLRQETDFPRSQSSTLTISTENPTQFALNIRRPGWAGSGLGILVNGDPVDAQTSTAHVSIVREWSDGDQVEVILPMDFQLEPLADNEHKAAITYGPILLAGQLGDARMQQEPIPYGGYDGFDGRWDHRRYEDMELVEALSFDVGDQPIQNWISPVEGQALHFRTQGVGSPNDVELAPFYEVNHQRYAIYWDITRQ